MTATATELSRRSNATGGLPRRRRVAIAVSLLLALVAGVGPMARSSSSTPDAPLPTDDARQLVHQSQSYPSRAPA
jgi:hypothetical protein